VSRKEQVSRIPEHLDVFRFGPDRAVGTTWWDHPHSLLGFITRHTEIQPAVVVGLGRRWNIKIC
jgi:hypothetical protein